MKRIFVYSDVKCLDTLFDNEMQIDRRATLEYNLDWFVIILQRNRFYQEASIDAVNQLVDQLRENNQHIPNILLINIAPTVSPLETPIMFSFRPEKECKFLEYEKDETRKFYRYKVYSRQIDHDIDLLKNEFFRLILGTIERQTGLCLEVDNI